MKRLFQFRLRTMLVAVTALSLYLGWLVHSSKQQRAMIVAIEHLGGWIYYDFQIVNHKYDPNARSWVPEWLRQRLGHDFFHNVVQVNLVYNDDGPARLENQQTSDAALKYIAQLSHVESVALKEGQATDNGLRELCKLKHLRSIFMWDASEVTDAGMNELSKSPELTYVHCSNAKLTDTTLKTFSKMKNIWGLSLQGNHFTNRGLEYLVDLPQLKSLWIGLGSLEVTDAGLKTVERMKRLQELDIQEAPVTRNGITELMRARPGLTIYHGIADQIRAQKTASGPATAAN